MTLLFHTVHLLCRPVQERTFPSVPWDSASLEELRKGPKCAVTCGGRRRREVGGGSRGEAPWKTPSKNWKHAASLRSHWSSQRVQYCFRVIASLNASINTFLHPSGYTDANQIVIICSLRVFVLFFVPVRRSYKLTLHKIWQQILVIVSRYFSSDINQIPRNVLVITKLPMFLALTVFRQHFLEMWQNRCETKHHVVLIWVNCQ